jgi:hypothetical protein
MATHLSFSTTATTTIFLGYIGNPVYEGMGSSPPSVRCWHTIGVSTCHLTYSPGRARSRLPDSARMECLVGGTALVFLIVFSSCCLYTRFEPRSLSGLLLPSCPSFSPLPIPILEPSCTKWLLLPTSPSTPLSSRIPPSLQQQQPSTRAFKTPQPAAQNGSKSAPP